jgi:hypothetical protein
MKFNIEDFHNNTIKQTSRQDQYFTLIDYQDFLDEKDNPRKTELSNMVYAKAIVNKKSKHIVDSKVYYSYYVLVNAKNEIYNPIRLHSSIKSKSDFVDKVCKTELIFKEVDKSIFDMYISFLKTKNLRLLKNINRSLK